MKSIRALLYDSTKAFQFLQATRFTCYLLLGVFLVKIGISKAQVSTLEFLLFITYLFSFFWVNGLNNSTLNFFPTLSDEHKKQFFPTTTALYFLCSLLLVAIALGYLFVSNHISYQLGIPFGLYFVFHSSSFFIEAQFLVKQQAKQILVYASAFLLYPIFALLGYSIASSIEGVLWGLSCWAFLRFMYLVVLFLQSHRAVNLLLLKRFVMFSTPLIIYYFLGATVEFVDGLLIRHYFPVQFAEYRYGARELPLYSIFITSTVSAILPLAVLNLTSSLQSIKSTFTTYMHYLFPLAIILMFISEYLFRFFYSGEYVFAASIFNVYLLLIMVRILPPQLIFMAKQKNTTLMIVAIAESIVNICFSFLFLHYFGLIGIVYATFIAFIVEKIILIYLAHSRFRIALHSMVNIPIYIGYSLLLLTAFIINHVILL